MRLTDIIEYRYGTRKVYGNPFALCLEVLVYHPR